MRHGRLAALVLIAAGCFALIFVPALDAGARLMSRGDAFGLAISLAVLVYLVYALFRGEKL